MLDKPKNLYLLPKDCFELGFKIVVATRGTASGQYLMQGGASMPCYKLSFNIGELKGRPAYQWMILAL